MSTQGNIPGYNVFQGNIHGYNVQSTQGNKQLYILCMICSLAVFLGRYISLLLSFKIRPTHFSVSLPRVCVPPSSTPPVLSPVYLTGLCLDRER